MHCQQKLNDKTIMIMATINDELLKVKNDILNKFISAIKNNGGSINIVDRFGDIAECHIESDNGEEYVVLSYDDDDLELLLDEIPVEVLASYAEQLN